MGSTLNGGNVTFRIIIPNAVPAGVQTLTMRLRNFEEGIDSGERSTNMTIFGAFLTATPDTVVPNQTFTLSGSGFTRGQGVTIASISIAGEKLPPNAINNGNQVTVDSNGSWIASVGLPLTSATTSEGVRTLKVTDSSGREGVVGLLIPATTLLAAPAASRPGSTIEVAGTGWPANDAIQVEYDCGDDCRKVTDFRPDAFGNFSLFLTVPSSAPIPSTNAIRATVTGPVGGSRTVTILHQVPNAFIVTEPFGGPPGTIIEVKGAGFPSFSEVSMITIKDISVLSSPAPVTDSEGIFVASIPVPQLSPGNYIVATTVGGVTAGTNVEVTTLTVPRGLVPVDEQLAPLLAVDNLVMVFHLNEVSQEVTLYDPRPEFGEFIDLFELIHGRRYCVVIDQDQVVTLAGIPYKLLSGWNLITWGTGETSFLAEGDTEAACGVPQLFR